MTITEKYIQLILPYLDDDIETELINGLNSYKFSCPFCTMYVQGEQFRKKKCASLVPIKDSFDYKFICSRSWSCECRSRGGGRSFRNFLRMFNEPLADQYDKELNLTRGKNFQRNFY